MCGECVVCVREYVVLGICMDIKGNYHRYYKLICSLDTGEIYYTYKQTQILRWSVIQKTHNSIHKNKQYNSTN